ncbi:substrate-binding domain-containing protein [Diplocloster modestus]|uniref:Substrate-binding domain-containing protein n=1 Tax=Diplocloster modestus TaxID=2850322 RepID=A0ABS6K1F1_9FIRM|nr:substrate-binding domain-containing protein [Diplocloster modestus]MBU9724673.1 substrate-binding domain-containing protein [Diplocloster modestus]
MKKKLISLLTSMAMIAILLTGCGSTPDTAADSDAAAKPQSEETPKAGQPDDKADTKSAQEGSSDVHNDLDYDAANKTYAFVFKATGNPNGEKQMEGFKKVIEAYGGNVILKSPEAATVEGQITIVNELIQQKVDCIAITGNDVDALQPILTQAMDAGIKVLSTDGQVNPDSRMIHVNQADSKLVGQTLAKGVADMIGGSGEIAVLSATSQSANQNTWIGYMQDELDANFKDVKCVEVAYGDDEFQKSVDQTQALITNYPDLKAIVAPTTVGIAAAAKVVSDEGLTGKISVTGLGLPSEMAEYIESGVCPYMYLWNPDYVGALTAYTSMALVDGKITGAVGDSFEGYLGDDKKTFKVTEALDGGTEVLLGEPFEFNSDNIAEWKNVF